MALGAPISYITHHVNTLRCIPIRYMLATEHMKQAGFKDLSDSEIRDKVLAMALEESMPSWRMQVTFSLYMCACFFDIQ